VFSRDSVLAANRPNHPATAASQRARETQPHLKAADSAGNRRRREAGCFGSHGTLPRLPRNTRLGCSWYRHYRGSTASRQVAETAGRRPSTAPLQPARGWAALCRLRAGARVGCSPGRSAGPVIGRCRSTTATATQRHPAGLFRPSPWPVAAGRGDISRRRDHEHLADLRRDGVLDRRARSPMRGGVHERVNLPGAPCSAVMRAPDAGRGGRAAAGARR
jgi:hypothetical protein